MQSVISTRPAKSSNQHVSNTECKCDQDKPVVTVVALHLRVVVVEELVFMDGVGDDGAPQQHGKQSSDDGDDFARENEAFVKRVDKTDFVHSDIGSCGIRSRDWQQRRAFTIHLPRRKNDKGDF